MPPRRRNKVTTKSTKRIVDKRIKATPTPTTTTPITTVPTTTAATTADDDQDLARNLSLLINNPKYSDIEILCEDGKKVYGCRPVLAARSKVFERLFYNGMKESYENKISLPNINSSIMEIILQYIYTGSIREESLNKDNIVEAFYAADYFQLLGFQKDITNIVNERSSVRDYAPELLSKIVEISDESILFNALIKIVATIPLNTVELGRLSINGLQHLLSCTRKKQEPFVTPEYELFRYSAFLVAKKISKNAYKTLMERLPTLEEIERTLQAQLGNSKITKHQQVVKELRDLIKFIDFRRIKADILVYIIEPLEIIPIEILLSIYRTGTLARSLLISNVSNIRGTLYFWDKSSCGSKFIIIENDRKVVKSLDNSCHCVRAKMTLENKGIFEWDVIIEKERHCNINVGVATENTDCKNLISTGWVLLNSSGDCLNFGNKIKYCQPFGEGAKITVHLNMDKRTCAFTVNGTEYSVVPSWNNLPSKLYPVVSLGNSGCIRIQPH